MQVFRSAFQEICRHVNATRLLSTATVSVSGNVNARRSIAAARLSPQLTVTQPNLLKWTLQTYSLEAKILLDAYKPGAAKGLHSLGATRDLSNSVHHFAHALEYTLQMSDQKQVEKNLQLAGNLRRQVYTLMLQNLNAQRALHLEERRRVHGSGSKADKIYPYPRDWPELVKTVATAGQHLLTVGE